MTGGRSGSTGSEPGAAYQVLAPEAYVQIKNLIERTVASGLIYMNSHAADFAAPELRKYLYDLNGWTVPDLANAGALSAVQ